MKIRIDNRPDLIFEIKDGISFCDKEIDRSFFEKLSPCADVRVWIRGGTILTGEISMFSDERLLLKVDHFAESIVVHYEDIWNCEVLKRDSDGCLPSLDIDLPIKRGSDKFFRIEDPMTFCGPALKIHTGDCLLCGYIQGSNSKDGYLLFDVPFLKKVNGTFLIQFRHVVSFEEPDYFNIGIKEAQDCVKEMYSKSEPSENVKVMYNDPVTGFYVGIRKIPGKELTEYYLIYRNILILCGNFILSNGDEDTHVKTAGAMLYDFFFTMSSIFGMDEMNLSRS